MSGITILCLLGASGCGKSTVADHLVKKHGFVRHSFARPLKDMLLALGLTEEDINGSQHHRSRPHPLLLGKSPRYAMQTLGTEWRDYIDKTLWANITLRRIKDEIAKGGTRFVIDDMRFPHEADLFFEVGGYTMAVRRPSAEATEQQKFVTKLPQPFRWVMSKLLGCNPLHPSESLWYGMDHDITVHNSGTLNDLLVSVDDWVEQLLEGIIP